MTTTREERRAKASVVLSAFSAIVIDTTERILSHLDLIEVGEQVIDLDFAPYYLSRAELQVTSQRSLTSLVVKDGRPFYIEVHWASWDGECLLSPWSHDKQAYDESPPWKFRVDTLLGEHLKRRNELAAGEWTFWNFLRLDR